MSKRTVQKKKPEIVSGPTTPDARVAQQMRVLEIVGTTTEKEKKWSPRTEEHVDQLVPVLDYFGYSRSDTATLVRRCHHDDQQIQIAVANIIDDRANHEQTQWGVVRTKKQLKEDRKLREEEEKKEKDRIEEVLEQQRKEAERLMQEEADASAAREVVARQAGVVKDGINGDDCSNASADVAAGSHVTLPPDPAILFAGPLPTNDATNGTKEDWWEGFSSSWSAAKGKDWTWSNQWDDCEWVKDEGSSNKDDGWWSARDWCNNNSGASGSNNAPVQRNKNAFNERSNASKRDTAEMWDMPDAAAPASAIEGGLDQWALGDIRAHERRVAGSDSEPGHKAMPLEGAMNMRTVEEVEREQLSVATGGVGGGGKGRGGRQRGDGASKGHEARGGGASGQDRRGRGRSNKGGSRGEKGRGGRSDRSGNRGERRDTDGGSLGDGGRVERTHADRGDRGDDSVEVSEDLQEGKDRMDHDERDDHDTFGDKYHDRLERSEDPKRQPMEEVGENVTVRKHSSIGCAVISLRDARVREAILSATSEVTIGGNRVQLKPHTDKDTQQEVLTDIFAAWGRQAEKSTPVSEHDLMKFFDAKHTELTDGWFAEAQEKARQSEERARQQKLLEEHQRQQAEQREREETRRRFEAEINWKQEQELRQAEVQRKMYLEEQQRQEEQRRLQQECQQPNWMNEMLTSWPHAAAMGPGGVGGRAVHDPRGAMNSTGALTSPNVAVTSGPIAPSAGNAQSRADPRSGVSPSGLNAAAAAYPPQWTQAHAQWMQAMYQHQQQHQMQHQQHQQQHQQQHGWQAMAQRGMQPMPGAMGAMAGQPDYDSRTPYAAAYYTTYMTDQQGAHAYAQQGGYMTGGQQNTTFGYSPAAYGRGERI